MTTSTITNFLIKQTEPTSSSFCNPSENVQFNTVLRDEKGHLGLLPANATAEIVRLAADKFFASLRQQGVLLSQLEFDEKFSSLEFVDKPDPSRIFGRNYLVDAIQKLQLKHIKVPENYLVAHADLDKVAVQLDPRIGLIFPDLQTIGFDVVKSIKDSTLSLKSRKILPVARIPTREEVLELFRLAEEVCYWDLGALLTRTENILIAEDGIYIVDTEFRNFTPLPPFTELRGLRHLRSDDQEWYLDEVLNPRIKKYREDHPKANFVGNFPHPISYENDDVFEPFTISFSNYLKI